jgi:AdoMet-dependent heme synthase
MKKYILHQVLIHTTSKCNLSCKHCYAKNFLDELNLDEIKKIMDIAERMGTSLCHLSGGEFFIRKDFKKIINYASSRFSYVEITSNGILVTEDTCNFLRGKITKLIISLEGPDAESNDEIRGVNSFKKAIKSIKLAKKCGLNVGINFTITKKNIGFVPEMIKLYKKLGIGFLNFRRFIPVGAGKEIESLSLSSNEYLKLNLLINKEQKIDKKIALAGEPTRILFNTDVIKRVKFAGCMAGIALISINPNGDVTPCGYLNCPIGNIKKQSLESIWKNSKILKKLRDRNNLNGKCGNCNNKMICGGCRAAAYARTGDLFAEDPLCWMR